MPSLIPEFEYDIFVSYRQKDNKGDHWVTELVNALKTELEATFKDDVSIYFDENPHDGLLETHQVDKSLSGKLRCVVFIPIISQTYCDPKSFAWEHELLPFIKMAAEDKFGKDVIVARGNVSSRVLPVKIHELDATDTLLLENALGGPVRSVNFIYKSAGVNRPLRINEDNSSSNLNKTFYRDQINKVANAVKEIIQAMENPDIVRQFSGSFPTTKEWNSNPTSKNRKILTLSAIAGLFLALISYGTFYFVIHKSPALPDKSIAILPFENLSGDPSQEYFGDGIAEEIRNALSQVDDLKVPGRSSSLQFRGKSIDLAEVGRKLKVGAVLEGSVRRQGNRVRIDVDLISIENGYHLWSQQFERTVDDIFAIQEEIAIAVTQKLKVTLLQNEKIEVSEDFTKSNEAHDAFLKGRYFWIHRKLKESEKYFKLAIELDSTYASAYAGLAETYAILPFFQLASADESLPKAEVAAEMAIKQDSMRSIPYLVLGFKSCYYDRDRDRAKKYFKKGLSLNPKYAEAHYWYGYYLIFYESDFEGSIAEMRKAVDLEPQGSISYACLGWALMNAERFGEGAEMNKIAIELNRQNILAYPRLGNCLLSLGQFKEARKVFEESVALTRSEESQSALVYLAVKDKDFVRAQELFDGLVEHSRTSYVSPVMMSQAASYLGQRDLAHKLLKEAFDVHDVWIVGLINRNRLPHDLFTDSRNVALMDQFFGKVPNARYRMSLGTNQ